MKLRSLFAGISLFIAAGLVDVQAAAVGWLQGKKVIQVRVQTGDAWFKVEGENTLYSWDPTSVNGKNWLSVVLAAKSSGQKIEWLYDNAITRCGGACYLVYGVGLMP